MESITSAQGLREAIQSRIAEARGRSEYYNTQKYKARESGMIEALQSILPYVESMASREEAQEDKKAMAMRMASSSQPAESWGELKRFVLTMALGEGEYFIFDHGLDLSQGLWDAPTRSISVYASPGSNEGYYVSIDRYRVPGEGQSSHVLNMAINVAMGKFWSHQEALRASDLITRFIYGWPMPESEPKAHSLALRLQADDVALREALAKAQAQAEETNHNLKLSLEGLVSLRSVTPIRRGEDNDGA